MKKLWEMKKKKNNKNNKGFSLVELIVVIAIMAVLVAVLAPAMLKYVENSRKSTDATVVSGIVSTVQAAIISDNVSADTYTVSIDQDGCGVSADDDDKIADALENAYNDYENELKLKANTWKEEGIEISFEVGADGKTSIEYGNDDFADYLAGESGDDAAE